MTNLDDRVFIDGRDGQTGACRGTISMWSVGNPLALIPPTIIANGSEININMFHFIELLVKVLFNRSTLAS